MPGGFRGVEGPRGPTKTTRSDEINEDFLVHAALYTHGGYIVDWKVIAGKGGYWIESLAPRPIWQFMSMISQLTGGKKNDS